MIARRVIPCLDVAGGRVVKGVRFEGLVDCGDPVRLAQHYEAEGADELVLLDISATNQGRGHALELVRAVRAVLGIPLCVGGGLRCLADAEALLYAGADKVALNTAAWRDPSLITALARRFGAQCTVVAIDARRALRAAEQRSSAAPAGSASGAELPDYELVVAAGREPTGADAIRWGQTAAELGAGELLVTSIDRDGTQSGYELPLLAALVSRVSVPVIASGGAQHAEHLAQALEAGASAVLLASILHSGAARLGAFKQTLIQRGFPLRPC